MAEYLASIFGTEKDRVNCPFYFKIGACRHGDRCSRLHNRPTISPTLVLANMYQRPDMITPGVDAQGQPIDPEKMQEHFEDFYEDIYEELGKFGEIENLNVCDNLADHMIGNVYVQFREEEQAAAAYNALQGRFYSGRPIIVEYSPEIPANLLHMHEITVATTVAAVLLKLPTGCFTEVGHRRILNNYRAATVISCM